MYGRGRLRTRFLPLFPCFIYRGYSSAGQSAGFASRMSGVQIPLSPIKARGFFRARSLTRPGKGRQTTKQDTKCEEGLPRRRELGARGRGNMAKRERAHGGCLGAARRGRARQAAKVQGEERASLDPWVPEWGNPTEATPLSERLNEIERGGRTA